MCGVAGLFIGVKVYKEAESRSEEELPALVYTINHIGYKKAGLFSFTLVK